MFADSPETRKDKSEGGPWRNRDHKESPTPARTTSEEPSISTDPQTVTSLSSSSHQPANTMTSSLHNESPTADSTEWVRSTRTIASGDSVTSPEHQLLNETEGISTI